MTVSEPQEAYGLPDGHDWVGGRLADPRVRPAGPLRPRGRSLRRARRRRSPRARTGSWPGRPTPRRASTSPDSETVLVTVPEEAFPDLAVVPERHPVAAPRAPRGARRRSSACASRTAATSTRARRTSSSASSSPAGDGRARHAGDARGGGLRRRVLDPAVLDAGRGRHLHGPRSTSTPTGASRRPPRRTTRRSGR